MGGFCDGGITYPDRLAYPPLAPGFFRTLLRWFRVALPFIAWLVGVLVAKPKGEPKKKAKK